MIYRVKTYDDYELLAEFKGNSAELEADCWIDANGYEEVTFWCSESGEFIIYVKKVEK